MGTSTNGQLSFGVVFEDGFEFPWDADPHDGDIESWWRDVRGFVNPVEYPYDESGEYNPGIDEDSPVVDQYFDNQRNWLNANPIPVELVNYCSGDYPMYLLATKHVDNYRGSPKLIDVDSDFIRDTADAEKKLREFLDEFGIESDGEIGWWLSSYWG